MPKTVIPRTHLLFPHTHSPQLNRKSEMKYCDACNTWIKNHPAAIAMHEQGTNHKANVAKRELIWVGEGGGRVRRAVARVTAHSLITLISSGLHEQRLNEEKRVKDEVAAKKTLAAAEAEAETQFKEDQAAAEAARAALGAWVSVCGRSGREKGGVFFLSFFAHPTPSIYAHRRTMSRATCTTPGYGSTTTSAFAVGGRACAER